MPESLPQFFLRVTGKEAGILPYQLRYGSNPFFSTLLTIPTGLGKTDAVIVPWLYAQYSGDKAAPTRLIIVLPRQNLTNQTAATARKRVNAAAMGDRIKVLELMAGSDDNRETIGPHEPAIIVSTQDLYLSRALNRGYARRPQRWPIDFALFNNDCLIVYDEVQLMSDGLATSTQMAAMRHRFGTFGPVPNIWMSATVNPDWLSTIDFREHMPGIRRIALDEEDRKHDVVRERLAASKRLTPAPADCSTPEGCAAFTAAQFRCGERILVIVNTVDRAREVYDALLRHGNIPGPVLLHSRFRPGDRQTHVAKLGRLPEEGQVVVATQVLEAGIDITAHRLITDLAPWGSMVQRFGRANRYGDIPGGADIWWVERPLRSKVKAEDPEKLYAPYDRGQIELSKARLEGLTSVSPKDLLAVPEDGPPPWRYVLRRSDLEDLFDTTPDLGGNEIDVSRFIRSGEVRDCYVAWRDWSAEQDPPALELRDEELCPVPIDEKLKDFIKKHKVFSWSFVDRKWKSAEFDRLYPGLTLLARAADGGYTAEEGWAPSSKQPVPPVPASETAEEPESDDADSLSLRKSRQTLSKHTEYVLAEITAILDALNIADIERFRADLHRAAELHDWGKAHRIMQNTLRAGEDANELLAKSAANRRHEVKHFRHELATGLAMLASGESDLSAYVAAAHHGKIRLTIRSMPGETHPELTRGIRHGDTLEAGEIAPGVHMPKVTLSLDAMKLGLSEAGEPSWTDRVLQLLDQLGPFRLVYLEMLLRAADERASARIPESSEAAACVQ
jgi:CRISPR-associated endonuclease/helicase Cas3